MLTVKPVYKLLNMSDDLKWTTKKAPSFFYLSTTRPPYFYPSIFVFTRPNDGWTGLYIKLWNRVVFNSICIN